MESFELIIGGPVESLVSGSDDYIPLGEKREGIVGKVTIWAHIQGGKLVDIVEISQGLFGERGAARTPRSMISAGKELEYFTQLGIHPDTYKYTLKPLL